MFKHIALSLLLLGLGSYAQAFSPIQYVQISTNTLSHQSGAITIDSGTITNFNSTGTIKLGNTATTITISTQIIFSPTTSGIRGTSTNDTASSGTVGEYIEGSWTSLSIAGASLVDVSTITLTAGDWEISLINDVDNTHSTTDNKCAIGTVANSLSGLTFGVNALEGYNATTTVTDGGCIIPSYRKSISATTTIYAIISITPTSGNAICTGRISARRFR